VGGELKGLFHEELIPFPHKEELIPQADQATLQSAEAVGLRLGSGLDDQLKSKSPVEFPSAGDAAVDGSGASMGGFGEGAQGDLLGGAVPLDFGYLKATQGARHLHGTPHELFDQGGLSAQRVH
jgi:hypothetical protein